MCEQDSEEINKIIEKEIELIRNDHTIDDTEKEMLIKARVGQGIFRKNLIEKYEKCIITGIDEAKLLLASHIKPWCYSNNVERLSVENGLLLSPLYDSLFDKGLITFDDDMRILISNKLSAKNIAIINIDTSKKYIEKPSDEMLNYMKYHRKNIFKN